VAEQTYPNIQLVVVDDGSPQADVPAALDAVESQYEFARRGWSLLREENRYLGAARNRGVRESKGEYILFMDDDNVAKPFEVRTTTLVCGEYKSVGKEMEHHKKMDLIRIRATKYGKFNRTEMKYNET
jgi:glycosyltransferase involved in cell wall biosynthesis